MSFFSFFNPFARPTAFQAAQQELAEARSALLSSQTAQEWAESQVAYNKARIARLEKAVKELHKLGPMSFDMTFKFENTAHKPPFQSPPSAPPLFTSSEVTTTKVKNAKPKGPSNRTVSTSKLAVSQMEGRQDSPAQAGSKAEAINP